jgi:signal transduction histidine kinase
MLRGMGAPTGASIKETRRNVCAAKPGVFRLAPALDSARQDWRKLASIVVFAAVHIIPPMKRILVIDDDETLLATLAVALRAAGYEVETTTSGQEGLRRAYELLPDLILCDVHMPDIEGPTVLQALRVDPATADLQVVLMTGVQANLPVRSGMDLGADDFLQKPFTVMALLQCVAARLCRGDLHRRIESHTLDELRRALQSTLPHEFFTPLAGILGLAELLRADYANIPREEAETMLGDIERSARRLHRSLTNYLKILELQSENTDTPAAPLPAEAVAEVVATAARVAADRHERNADLKLEIAPLMQPLSEDKLATVVEELVDNACNFSRKNTPVSVQLGHEGAQIALRVADQGRGMTPAQVQQVGTFQQFDRRKYEQQGLGLGLALVRKLASMHGGDLRIDSQPGTGTICTLLLPAARP